MILIATFKPPRRGLFRSKSALASLASIVIGLLLAPADAAMVKCVDSNGKVSYQDPPCPTSAAESTVKFKAPPPAGPSPQAADLSPVPSRQSNMKGRARIPSDTDFRGPREAWGRLTLALARGDKAAAMKELTPSAQQRYSDMLEKLSGKTKPVEIDRLGAVRSVTLTGDELATITLTRKKADGTYGYKVMLMRGADGRWRIENM